MSFSPWFNRLLMSGNSGSSQAKRTVGAVADAQPDDSGSGGISNAAGDEVLVFRDHCSTLIRQLIFLKRRETTDGHR